MSSRPDDDRSRVAWPSELSPDGDTIQHDPTCTIVPRRPQPNTASRSAVGALSRLGTDTSHGQRLVLEDTLGQGGMAVVRLGTQRSLGRKVAVKSLRQGKRHSQAAVTELMQEAWVTGALEHPNVVPIHDVDFDAEGNPLVVLKLIDGVPWRELMRDPAKVRERFGATDVLEWNLGILSQVLNAVRYAHSRGIIHRDLKPDNVMIGEFGEVYLVDWGIAVSLRDDGSGRLPLARDATDLAGTLCYMAPEMLPGMDIPLSERTDVYLAGSILYEILTGRPPHDASSIAALTASVVDSNPDLPEDTPRRLAAICRRAMDPDPDGRFENAEQVRLAIQGYLRHRGAMRLLAEAETRLHELHTAAQRANPENLGHRQVVYKLYGECRFGFREARSSGQEDHRAQRGLERATRLMIEYELASGDPRAAATLLADLPVPVPALALRIEQSLAAHEAEKQRRARLERLGRAFDMRAGSTARRGLILVLGVVWVVMPLINQWLPGDGAKRTHAGVALTTGIFLALSLCIGFLARDMLRQSLVNVRYFAVLVFVYLAHGVLQLGLAIAGLPLTTFLLINNMVNFVILSMVAIAIDVRMWPTAVAYGLAFLSTAQWPEVRFYVQSATSLVLVVNAFIIWRPRQVPTRAPSA